jgi:hypothetical protein
LIITRLVAGLLANAAYAITAERFRAFVEQGGCRATFSIIGVLC